MSESVKDKKEFSIDIPLNGKLRTYIDPLLIQNGDFRQLTNMRYTATNPKGIGGMTKITSSAPTYLKHRAGIHFVKTNPDENHVLVQSYNDARNSCVIQEITASIPNTGDFSATPVYTIASTWTAGTSYTVGDVVFPATYNGCYYECVIAGTAGVTEPSTTTEYAKITDGTVTWVCRKGDLKGTFSQAPDGCIAFANGHHTLLWGGNEFRCGRLINFDANNTFLYDYTDRINNDSTDALNTAILYPAVARVDSNTKALYHFNDDVTDVTGNHNGTAVGTPYYVKGKFGNAIHFDGSTQYVTVPDHADFDFSGGAWCVEGWFLFDDLLADNTIYYQGLVAVGPATDWMQIYVTATGAVVLDIYSGGISILTVRTADRTVSTGSWTKIAVCENGDDYRIMVGTGTMANLKAYTVSSLRPANYNGVVIFGAQSDYDTYPVIGDHLNGKVDELRISDIGRYTGSFASETAAFGSDSTTSVYIGSSLPGLTAIKWYVNRANAAAGSPTIYYWNGSAWVSVGAITDNTASGGASLAQTGTTAFADTTNLNKPKLVNNIFLYWFKIVWSALDNTASVYRVTLQTVMQPVVDIWDGQSRGIVSCQKYTVATGYEDNTTNVLKQDATTSLVSSGVWDYPPETYLKMASFLTTSYLYFGFSERVTGIYFILPHNQVNTNAAAVTIEYWNGSAWTTVGTVDDQTVGSTTNKSLANSGYIMWNQIAELLEFKTHVSTSTEYWYYRLSWNAALSANCKIDFIAGVPAQKTITRYNFPAFWLNSLLLCGQSSNKKNSILSSAPKSPVMLNGSEQISIELGVNDDLVSGCTLFSRYGSDVTESFIVHKKKETWYVSGTGSKDVKYFKISGQYGNVAPSSLAVCDLGYEVAPGINKAVAIWQSQLSIVMFDNGSVIDASDDIRNFFLDMGKTVTDRVHPSYADKSQGFFDPVFLEYHWCFADGSSTGDLTREFVYDITRRKWYEVDRPTGKRIQLGLVVADIVGNKYNYGMIDTGHVLRLEYGTSMDGEKIPQTMWIGDKPLAQSAMYEMEVNNFKLIGVVTGSTAPLVITHYLNGATTGKQLTSFTQTDAAGKRVYQKKVGTLAIDNKAVLHGFKFYTETDDVACGFEPLALAMIASYVKIDK